MHCTILPSSTYVLYKTVNDTLHMYFRTLLSSVHLCFVQCPTYVLYNVAKQWPTNVLYNTAGSAQHLYCTVQYC
jgi:hypothetical protein